MELDAIANDATASRITPQTLASLRAWEGRSETVHDQVNPSTVLGMAATLDLSDVGSAPGDALRPLWHWALFNPRVPQSAIGDDGHPRRGGFLPPVPLPRRMWAGGRLQWHGPLCVGDAVRRNSRIGAVSHKAGRTGDLLFVTVQHEIHGPAGLAVSEEHDIVYRAAPRPADPVVAPLAAPADAAWTRQVTPDPVLLFRYSALTFNGHRIHYDRSYVTQVEGYPGLVVHGPLIATLLAELGQRENPGRRVRAFSFKAVRPTFDLHPFDVCGKPAGDGAGAELWGSDHEGFLTMQARIDFD